VVEQQLLKVLIPNLMMAVCKRLLPKAVVKGVVGKLLEVQVDLEEAVVLEIQQELSQAERERQVKGIMVVMVLTLMIGIDLLAVVEEQQR